MAAKRMLLSGLGLLTLTVGVTALAWACTPTAGVALTGSGGSGFAYPGDDVRVEVSNAGSGPVMVRWGGETGQVVASGTGPVFATSFKVPAVADGVYVVAVTGSERNIEGEVKTGRASLRVGEPGTTGSNTGTNTSGAGSTARSPAPGSSPTSGSANGGENVVSGRDSRTASGAEQGVARARAQGGGSAGKTGAGATADTGVKTLASGQAVFADSVGANTPKGATPAKRGSAARSAKAAPSKSTASGDLWSGFASGKAPAASLGSSAGPESGPGSALTLGLALSAFGLLALAGGAGVAEARRRRRLARSRS